MSLDASPGPGCETRSLSPRPLSQRYEQITQLQQERREEETRNAARQRVEEVENLLRRHPFPDPEPRVNGEIPTGSVHTPPLPPKYIASPSRGSIEIPALQEYTTLCNGCGPHRPSDDSFYGDDIDQAAASRSSMSFHTANPRPCSSSQSDTSVDTVKETTTEKRGLAGVVEDDQLDIDLSMVDDPRVQALEQELRKVQDDHKQLEKALAEARREIDGLRNQVDEAEERCIQAPSDPTKAEELQILRTMLRQSQAQRRALENQLEEAEKRERELKRELHQAKQDLDENEIKIERLRDELMTTKYERDLHEKRASSFQYQLKTAQQQQGVQVEHVTHLAGQLDRCYQERERYENRAAQLEAQLQERQLEGARAPSLGRRGTTGIMPNDMSFARARDTDISSKTRKNVEVEKRKGQLRIVRRAT